MNKKTETIDLSAFEITPEVRARQAANWKSLKIKIIAGVLIFIAVCLLIPVIPYGLGYIMFLVVVFGLKFGSSIFIGNARREPNEMLQRFATDNGLMYEPFPNYQSKGVIFYAGNKDQEVYNLLSGELYGYRYNLYWLSFTSGKDKSQKTNFYSVVEVRLPKAVPNIFLDAVSNDSFMNPEVLNKFQRKNILNLEGDFNKYFKVYAASGYETEVLQLLNPAFMQALIKRDMYEVELIEDRAFVYLKDSFVPDKEALMKQYEVAEFVILELQKELDTFSFKPHPKIPDEMAVEH